MTLTATDLVPAALTPAQEALLPTEADVRSYEEHGFWISGPVMSDEVLDEAFENVARFHRGERDANLPEALSFSDWREGDPGPARVNMHVGLRSRAMRRLILQPVLGAIAARLARTPEIRLFEDELIYKEPTPATGDAPVGATGWHTDWSYTSTLSSPNTLTAWTPLHDVDRERGPLVMLDGSHRWDDTEHLREFHQQDLASALDRFAETHAVREVPILLERGQVSFHHCRTVHGSYPNRSDHPRIAVAAHLQDRDNAYRTYHNGERRIHHALDAVVRRDADGAPDYTDPAYFPVVWPTGPGA